MGLTDTSKTELKGLEDFTLADLEAIRLLLRGGSVIDWHRLNFEEEADARAFLRALEYDHEDETDRSRAEAIKHSAMSYVRRNFDFPIPRPVANLDIVGLLMLASTKGHRQLCACTILKVMHIIYHLESRELLFTLPISDQEVFHLVEQKVYRVIGGMLARGLPLLEFIGGRKNKDSLYTKLLSKKETVAAQIYDKIRFRLVTRTRDDVFPVLNYLMRELFPFNYVIPGESTNSLFNFRDYCEAHPTLASHMHRVQLAPDLEEVEAGGPDNMFSARNYRVVHFVVDLPVRLPQDVLENAPPGAWSFGRVIFVQAEFQVIDRETEHTNELGEASHDAYKLRQRAAVQRRLKLGAESQFRRPTTVPPPLSVPVVSAPVLDRLVEKTRGRSGRRGSNKDGFQPNLPGIAPAIEEALAAVEARAGKGARGKGRERSANQGSRSPQGRATKASTAEKSGSKKPAPSKLERKRTTPSRADSRRERDAASTRESVKNSPTKRSATKSNGTNKVESKATAKSVSKKSAAKKSAAKSSATAKSAATNSSAKTKSAPATKGKTTRTKSAAARSKTSGAKVAASKTAGRARRGMGSRHK